MKKYLPRILFMPPSLTSVSQSRGAHLVSCSPPTTDIKAPVIVMSDDGLELNIISDVSVLSQRSKSKGRKRGSERAWDKKRTKKAPPKHAAPGEHKRSEATQQQPRRENVASDDGDNEPEPSTGGVVSKSSAIRSQSIPIGQDTSNKGKEDSATSAKLPKPASTATRTRKQRDAGRRPVDAAFARTNSHTGADPGDSESVKAGDKAGDPAKRQRASTSGALTTEAAAAAEENGRVAQIAGLPARSASQSPAYGSGAKRDSASPAPESKGGKRKRPRVSSGPVARDGVVDFWDDSSTRSHTGAPARSRRAAASAASVARATATMEKGGSKWWDGDDDDPVMVRRANAVKHAPAARDRYGSTTSFPADKDGGLPSDVRPNSVRPKPVDLDGEASRSMGILAALLNVADAAAGEEPSRSKATPMASKQPRGSDRKGRVTHPPRAGGTSEAAIEARDERTESRDSGAGEQVMSGAGEGEETKETEETSEGENRVASASGGVSASADGSVSRKKRGSANVPARGVLPEYHARPRELSRRAAATPRPSKRSAHVMAAGPGATFAALKMPPKMVQHLEAPRANQGGGGMGLAGPTVCQLTSIPVLASGRNVVMKSETGSGKTLAFLLPMLCDLAAMEPKVDREKGTLAIVLAPTRELNAQILEVLMRAVRPFIWLVPGSLSGGERRKSEKARLRKGVTILVCTPGRLLDHLKTTKCFRRDLLRWLVLDEADRLLDMGFESQVKEIVELLDQSARAVKSGPAGGSRVPGGEAAPSIKVIRRQTVMVSATLDKGVSRLATALLSKYVRVDADLNVVEAVDEAGNASLISKGEKLATPGIPGGGVARPKQTGEVHGADRSAGGTGDAVEAVEEFSTPRQLVQYYMTVTQKLRLPALCAFLRARARDKVVVFMSTCDAVDFHHQLFRRAGWPGDSAASAGTAAENEVSNGGGVGGEEGNRGRKEEGDEGNRNGKRDAQAKQTADSDFFGAGCRVRRLHGNVPQAERQATYGAFSAAKSGVLICTDVAARGLDLPTVDWIVQYDPPAETADYVHRVGRTARKGERGHSLLFLLPKETAYLGVLEARGLRPKPLSLEGVLCAADAGKRDARRADEQLAYELQQGLQLLVASDKLLLDRARSAFQSHVRAYAARAPDSRAVFQVRSLHLGHVARSFALKDPPTAVKVGKKIVRRPGDHKGSGRILGKRVAAGQPVDERVSSRGDKRRRDGAGGAGGGVHKLGLSKRTELASRSEFL